MKVFITVLGGFSITVDGAEVPSTSWSRRSSAALVKLLALTEARQLHREQVMEALWPGISTELAAPRLHKAAHYARRALGDDPDGLILRNEQVLLLPGSEVRVDAVDFRRRAEAALSAGSVLAAQEALEGYHGALLPGDLYEPWAADWRQTVAVLHLDLLRLAGRWADILDENPADEEAHLSLARKYVAGGDVRAARRQLERLDQAARRELGTVPSPAAERLRAELGSGDTPSANRSAELVRLIGRRSADEAISEQLERAAAGRGSTVIVSGRAGAGKSAMLDLAVGKARTRGWRIGRGAASAVEGAWPYAPVLEAFGDLCRRHPALLDGLDDTFDNELSGAMTGQSLTWGGETAHQRLFVAAAELLRLAAAGHGMLLVVDDVHEADEASLRLLHYLARCAVNQPVVIALAARPVDHPPLRNMRDSILARGIGSVVDIAPLDHRATRRLLAHRFPELDDKAAEEIWAVSGGLPFRVLEAARGAKIGIHGAALAGLTDETLDMFRRVALLGTTFTTDELLAVSDRDEAAAYHQLDLALNATIVEPADTGYRFRHALVRDAVLSTFTPSERSRAGRQVADRLAELGAIPARIAHLFIASGHPVRAIPYARLAIDTAGALGAYRDGLALVDAVADHATGTDRAHLLARRADLLMAVADPAAVDAYRAALPVTEGTDHRLVRARLARAASFQGDLELARAALAGLDIEGDVADAPILLARGNLAYFSGDVAGAWESADAARARLQPDDPWQIVDMIGLQGMIAHQRGEWFERFRRELRNARANPGLTTAVFDAHLCVAEYLLYGPIPYDEVIELGERLRRRAERQGALRGIAFATALIGEAALLKGNLDLAERELREAVELHRDVDATAGEAHSLQRLAEVRLALGDRDEARTLLAKAMPLARWSVISSHLLQRVYATMIACADDPLAAVTVVEQAEATLGDTDRCPFCDVIFAVPATIACADVGDVEAAQRYLSMAQVSGSRWEGTAWAAAVAEAQAHVAAALGHPDDFQRFISAAVQLYTEAGQPLDTARCRARAAEKKTTLLATRTGAAEHYRPHVPAIDASIGSLGASRTTTDFSD